MVPELAHTLTHLTNLVKLWDQPGETDDDGLQQDNVLFVFQHGLLKDLERLGDEQSGGTVRLADHTKHQEGTALKGRVVEEGSSGGKRKVRFARAYTHTHTHTQSRGWN